MLNIGANKLTKDMLMEFISGMLDTDLEDKDKADNACEYIFLQLWILHCVNEDIDPDDIDSLETSARTFTDGCMNRLIDFIECKKGGLI